MGPLNALRKLADSGGAALLKKTDRRVGDAFYEAAETVPNMFAAGRQYELLPEDLEHQFGVKIKDMGPSENKIYRDTTVTVPGTRGPGFATEYLGNDPYHIQRLMGDALMGNMPPRAGMRPVEFGTTDFAAPGGGGNGGGGGKSGYAALFGLLRRDPDLVNHAPSLSATNNHRRLYNQSAALLRDPGLARQILVAQSQFKNRERPLPLEFYRRTPEEQVGALQVEGALQTLRRMETLAADRDLFPHGRGDMKRAYQLVSESDDPRDFVRAAGLIRGSGGNPKTYGTIGPSALKRAALVSDIFSGTSSPRRKLFELLEFRRGGRVGTRGR